MAYQFKPGDDNVSLKQLIQSMHEDYARSGGYSPTDMQRILGDQRKGIGLSVPSSWPKGEAMAAGANQSPNKPQK